MSDDCVGISGARHITVTGCELYGSPVTSGVYSPADGSWSNEDVTVTGCNIHDHNEAGIFLKDTLTYTITGNEIHDCGAGIQVISSGFGVDYGTIIGNNAYNLQNMGIQVQNGRFTIANNSIDNYYISASGNIIDSCGVFAPDSLSGSVIIGNTFSNGTHGIVYNGAPNKFTVSSNIGTNLSGYGHYFIGFTGDNFVISRNTLSGATGNFFGAPAASATKIFTDNL